VGVGGVVVERGRALLIRRGAPPLLGQWSIPGGLLESGETLEAGVVRELREETGLAVRVLELIEIFDRIDFDRPEALSASKGRARYHYVIADYLCERLAGEAHAASDASDVAWAAEDELPKYGLTPAATRVLRKAFALARNHSRR
jgi:mutator protein MutT